MPHGLHPATRPEIRVEKEGRHTDRLISPVVQPVSTLCAFIRTIPLLCLQSLPFCPTCVISPGHRKIPRYTATLSGQPALSGICCSNIRSGQRHTKRDRHMHLFGCTHNNYHRTADKRSSGHVGAVRVSASKSGGRLKVRPVLMECFGRGVSLVGEALDLYILPGTISLSLLILEATHHSPSVTVTDFGAKASVLTFPITHSYFCHLIHPVHYFCRHPPPPKLSISKRLEVVRYLILRASARPIHSTADLTLSSPVPSAPQEANNFLPVFDTGRGSRGGPCVKTVYVCEHVHECIHAH